MKTIFEIAESLNYGVLPLTFRHAGCGAKSKGFSLYAKSAYDIHTGHVIELEGEYLPEVIVFEPKGSGEWMVNDYRTSGRLMYLKPSQFKKELL